MDLYVIFGHLLLILGFLLAAVIVAHVLRRGGSPSGTIAWLLVVVLIPYVGVPLYLILGERKMRRAAGRKAGIKLPQIDTLPLAEANLLDRLLRSYDCPGATRGNRLDLCRTGEESYACLIDLIAQATRRICITTYVLGQDEVGRDIVERLARRAAEGIEVRLLIDDLGSARTKRRMLEPLIQAGGQAASFMPVLHLPLRGRANLRNHRKLVLVDDRLVMAGGTNIASEYIGPTPKPGRWRDISFLLQGPAVRHYAQIFYSDWEFASGERLTFNPESAQPISGPGDGSIVQVVPSGPDIEGDPLYDAILSAVFAAQKRFWIVTPYFIPNEALLQALTLAAHRGVEVLLVVPEKSNHPITDLARGTYVREVQAAGGQVMLYTGGMIHAKVILMDDELAIIGSANVDMRSLFLNYEVAMFAYREQDVRATEEWITPLFAQSRACHEEEVGSLRELGEGLVRILAPLL